MQRRRRRWLIGAMCILAVPCVGYALLPGIVPLVLQHVLSQQGYHHVDIRLGYPGWQTWHIPYVHFQRELGRESLSVTVERAFLQYNLASVFRGRIHQLTLPTITVALHGGGSDPAQPCQPADTAPTGPGPLRQLTVGHALQRLPALPWQRLILEQGRFFRECATGPLRDMQFSGILHQRQTAFDLTVTFEAEESPGYRFEIGSTPERTFQASLHMAAEPNQPILTLHSHVQPRADQVEITGEGRLDVTRLAPLLPLVMPHAEDIQALEGSLQAHWHATAPASVPLAMLWQHPETVLAGATSMNLKLPKTFALGEPCVLALQGEVAGNPAASTYRLGGTLTACTLGAFAAQEVIWETQGTLVLEAPSLSGTVDTASIFQVRAARLGDVRLPAGALRVQEPVSFRANQASGAWSIGPTRVALQVPRLTWQAHTGLLPQATLRLEALQGDAAGWQLAGGLTLVGRYADIAVEALDVRLKVQAAGASWRLPEPATFRLAARPPGLGKACALALQGEVAGNPAASTYRLEGTLTACTLGAFAAQEVAWETQGRLALEGQYLSVTVNTASGIQVRAARLGDLRLPAGALRVQEPVSFRTNQASGAWSTGPTRLALQMPRLTWQAHTGLLPQATLRLEALQGDAAGWQLAGGLTLAGRYADIAVEALDVRLKVQAAGASWRLPEPATFRLAARPPGLGKACALALQGEVAGQLAASTYRLEGTLTACTLGAFAAQEVAWETQGRLALEGQYLSGTVDTTSGVQLRAVRLGEVQLPESSLRVEEPVVFRANRASGAWSVRPAQAALQVPRLTWNEHAGLLQQATLRLEGLHGDAAGWQLVAGLALSGRYADIDLKGVAVRLKLQAAGATWSLPEPATFSIAAIEAGVQITDLGFTIQPAWGTDAALAWVELRDLQAALLGGYIRSPRWRYTPGESLQRLTLSVEQLDIQQLLQLEQQQHLEGTGTLDGVLPVLLSPTGLQIQDGRLSARPPGGVLRYRPAPGTGATPAPPAGQLAFVQQILANFHYQVLTVGVHYMEDGTLRLGATIQGQNPDWQQGHPIHLNLNVEENIPALLQSLQLLQGKGVEQSIQKHMQLREDKPTDATRKAIR